VEEDQTRGGGKKLGIKGWSWMEAKTINRSVTGKRGDVKGISFIFETTGDAVSARRRGNGRKFIYRPRIVLCGKKKRRPAFLSSKSEEKRISKPFT